MEIGKGDTTRQPRKFRGHPDSLGHLEDTPRQMFKELSPRSAMGLVQTSTADSSTKPHRPLCLVGMSAVLVWTNPWQTSGLYSLNIIFKLRANIVLKVKTQKWLIHFKVGSMRRARLYYGKFPLEKFIFEFNNTEYSFHLLCNACIFELSGMKHGTCQIHDFWVYAAYVWGIAIVEWGWFILHMVTIYSVNTCKNNHVVLKWCVKLA